MLMLLRGNQTRSELLNRRAFASQSTAVKHVAVVLLLAVTAACATPHKLEIDSAGARAGIEVLDSRSVKSKKGHADNASYMRYLGDDDFKPGRMEFLRARLNKHAGSLRVKRLSVMRFEVIDSYRSYAQTSAMGGAIGGLIGGLIAASGSSDDKYICRITVIYDGQRVAAKHVQPKAGAKQETIVNQTLQLCVDKLAANLQRF